MVVWQEIERLKGLPPGEPVFVLRGQDILAADTVRYWADAAEAADVTPTRKIAEARDWADLMEEWEPRRLPD